MQNGTFFAPKTQKKADNICLYHVKDVSLRPHLTVTNLGINQPLTRLVASDLCHQPTPPGLTPTFFDIYPPPHALTHTNHAVNHHQQPLTLTYFGIKRHQQPLTSTLCSVNPLPQPLTPTTVKVKQHHRDRLPRL